MHRLPILPHERQLEQRPEAEYFVMPQSESRQESHLSDYFGILKRRKWWIIIPFCLVMAIGVALLVFQAPVYQATTTLLIDDVSPKIAPVQEIIPTQTSPDFYPTQYQLIKSRTVVGALVEKLQLDTKPPQEPSLVERILKTMQTIPRRLLKEMINTLKGFLSETPAPVGSEGPVLDLAERRRLEAVALQQAKIQVRPRLGTKLVDIIMQGSDPVTVVEQVNTLAEIYIQENLETKLEASHKAIAWLQQKATTLQDKTDQATFTLEQFKTGKDFLPADDLGGPRQSTAQQRLDRLNTEYVEANAARLQLQTQITTLKKLSKQSLQEILEFPGIEENLFLRSLKTRFLEAQLEYANLSQHIGPKHPRLIQAKTALDEVSQTIGVEIHRMIRQLEKDYNTQQAKENMLAKELASQKAEVFGFSDDIRKYQSLRRDLDIDQDLHQAVSKRHAEAMLTEALTPNNIRIVERAMVSVPVSEAPKVIALNLFLGLALGVGLALITEYLDKRFKTADEVERYLGLPCLGVIPHQRRIRRLRKPITLQAPGSRIAEAYRTIRTWLQAPTSQTVKSLLITSATPAEGKSTTAANLAVSFAQLGWHVLLVDVDLRRPALHRAFGLTNDKEGLTDILVHGTDWHQVLRDTDLENLKILPAGFIPSNPVDLLSTRRMKAFTAQVRRAFDLVIFDAPMVLSLPEVTILAPTMDGVLLVHYPMRRDRNVVVQAKRLLERRGAPLLGVVLNNVNEKLMSYYTSYRYEGYSASAVRPVRLADDGAAAQAIDMRPGAEGENWIPEPPAVRARAATLSSIIQKTASNGDVMITIHTVSLRQRLGEEESDPGSQFLVLDVEIANAMESAYTFHAGQTTISVNPQNEYSRVLASLIEMPDRSSEAAVPLLQGRQVYKYDPVSTHQLEEGFAEEEIIAAKGVRRGLLVYRVPLEVDSYVFEYESADSTFTILLGQS